MRLGDAPLHIGFVFRGAVLRHLTSVALAAICRLWAGRRFVERILAKKEEIRDESVRFADLRRGVAFHAPLCDAVVDDTVFDAVDAHLGDGGRLPGENARENAEYRRPIADQNVKADETENAANDGQDHAEESAQLTRAERRRGHADVA